MATVPNRDQYERTRRYKDLRRGYDSAFREWIVHTRRKNSPTAKDREGDGARESPATAVRHHRDTIVDFLLSTTPHSFHPAESRVREAAYFFWINAGRPVETVMSDWISASRQLAFG